MIQPPESLYNIRVAYSGSFAYLSEPEKHTLKALPVNMIFNVTLCTLEYIMSQF